MAIDPQQIATEQTQRAALAQRGAPTEMAGSPENAVRLAGWGDVIQLLNKLPPNVSDNAVTPDLPPSSTLPPSQTAPAALPADLQAQLDTIPQADLMAPPAPKVDLPSRVPTPAELGLMSSPGNYSEIATKKLLAPQVLSEDGAKKFAEMGYRADGTLPEADPLLTAQEALDAETAQSVVDVNELAKRAMTANKQGFKETTAIAAEEASDEILAMVARNEANIKSLADGGDFNFDYLNTGDDVKQMITAVGEQLGDEQKLLTRGVITNKVTVNEAAGIFADEIGFTRQLLNAEIREGGLTAAQFVAARTILVKSGAKLADLANAIKMGTADAGDRLRFRRQLAIHQGIQLQIKGFQTEAARALQSFQIRVDGELDLDRFNKEAALMLANDGDVGVTDELAKKLLGALEKNDSLGAINKFAEVGWEAKTSRVIQEAYRAGLLSAPPTQIKNIVGTAAFMAYQLPEEVLGGMFGAVARKKNEILGLNYPTAKEQIYVTDALFRFKGFMDSYKDALRAASIAYKTEAPAAGKSKLDMSGDEYAGTSADQNSKTNPLIRGLSDLGKRMRIPFRLLLSADEFFKTMSQRGELYTRANREYQTVIREGGTEVEAQDAAGRLLLDPKSISEELDTKALYDTLQSDLGKFGELTSAFQRVNLGPVPVGRIIVPFATAPTNSALRTSEYMWLTNLKPWRDLFGRNSTPEQQQRAFGKLALGGMSMATIASYALEGDIIGGVPSDPKEREAFFLAGKKPYSFTYRKEGFPTDPETGELLPKYGRFGKPNGPLGYVSYNGFEPVSAVIGLTANVVQKSLYMNGPGAFDYLSAAVYGVVDYYTELPFLQGMADVQDTIDALKRGDGEGAFLKLARGPAEAAIYGPPFPSPVSSLQRNIARAIDPTNERPRRDIAEYYTIEDLEEKTVDKFGNEQFKYRLDDGTQNWDLVGTPKDDAWNKVFSLQRNLEAMQYGDSIRFMFGGDRKNNAVVFDTLGNAMNKEDFSLSNNPVKAMFNSTSGIKIKESEALTEVEAEVLRLLRVTGSMPLTNPEEIFGVPLSFGNQMDLVDLAKNKHLSPTYDDETFRDALYSLILSEDYDLERAEFNSAGDAQVTDADRVTLIKALNKTYLEEAFEELINSPENDKLGRARDDIIEARSRKAKGE